MDKTFKKNILKGSAATSIGAVGSMVFHFLSIMVMTRYLAKEEFGIYVLIIVVVNLFNLVGGLGLELTMVKSIASEIAEEKKSVLLPVLTIRGISLVIISVVFIISGRFILHYFDDKLVEFILYIPIIFILANLRDLFYKLLQGLRKFKQFAIVSIVSAICRFALVFSFAFFYHLDILILIYIEIIATAIPVVLLSLAIPFKNLTEIKPDKQTYKGIIQFSIPLYLNNMVVFFNHRANVFIIGLFLNPLSIANYDVASKIPQALSKIFSSFIVVYFPNLAALFSKGDNKNAVALIGKSLSTFSIAMIFLVLAVFLFDKEIIRIVFSEKYVESSTVFTLLTFNFYLSGLESIMGYSFVPAGKPSVPAKVNTLASIVSIGFSLLLIPAYGILGAAYSLLIMNTFTLIMFVFFLKKHNILPSIKGFLYPLAYLLSVVAIYIFIGNDKLIEKIIFIVFCILGAWVLLSQFRELSKIVIDFIWSMITKRKPQ